MYNPSIPALSYVDIPNYKTLKSNAQMIPKASDRLNVPQYEATIGQEGLQYDQNIGRANLMKEREAALTVADYSKRNFISNDPHQSDLRHRLLQTLKFSYPNIIYESVIADARTLPKILFLEQLVSSYYSRIIMNNITNIYTYSPSFYAKVLTSSDINFKMYERFIYLLTLIQIVLDNKDQSDFMEKDDRMRDVVEWCLTRKIQDINYLLQGPTSNQEYSIDFILMYNSLISPSSSKSSVSDYLVLATLQEVNANFLKYREEFIKNPNVYDKNPNYAQSYTISIDTRQNAKFKYDNIGNLVVDCNDVDLGSSTNDNVDLDINNTIVNTETLKYEPKSQPTKFANLLHQFSIFRIKSLLILKTTYKTALRNYDTCYITFPNITLDGRFNQVYKNGALQVAGKFKENNNNKYWEFEPFNDVVYIPKTANVKRFEFYVSPKPGTSNKPNPNNFKIASEVNKYFNIPIRVHSIEELNKTPLAPNHELLPETYIIRSYKISNKTGNPSPLKYTFLYNKTMKTIQVLPGQMDISNTPKFGVKKQMKTLRIHTGMMKPQNPATRVVIYESIKDAIYFNKTTFTLPRIIPLADLNCIEYLVGQARLKGEDSIKFDTDIRAYRFVIPEVILNRNFINDNISTSTALTEWLRIIINTVGYNIVESDNDEYNKLKAEVINKVNDALVNNKTEIYIVDIKASEIFPLDKYMPTLNPYEILRDVNSKEYDFSEELKVYYSAIKEIYNVDYIKNRIREAKNNGWNTVYLPGAIKNTNSTLGNTNININSTLGNTENESIPELLQAYNEQSNEHYEYFTLYLSDGSSFPYSSLPPTDLTKLYTALKNNRTSFKSELGITIYINYVPIPKIQSQIKSIGENYVSNYIRENYSIIPKTLELMNQKYNVYDLFTKEYLSDEEVEKNKLRIQRMEREFDVILNYNPRVIEKYYIEYYGDEIKNEIYKDINSANPQGIISIPSSNPKQYQYVYFDSETKDLIFEALRNNQNYYLLNGSKVSITLYSKDILIDSAKIYYFKMNNNDSVQIPVDDNSGFVDSSGIRYYYKLYYSQISEELNHLSTINYSDDDIENKLMDSINQGSYKFNGVEWIKIKPDDANVEITVDSVKYKGINAVVKSIQLNPTTYNDLYSSQSYTFPPEYSSNPPEKATVGLNVMGINRIRYELSKSSDNLWNYAIQLEGQLSDEYEQATRNYETYIHSDQTNIVDTSIPLPDILPTDTKDEIYRKWSNYYSYYGLFIPDFNYILDYQAIQNGPAQIYKDKDIVDIDDAYSLYDWMIPLYNVQEDGTRSRVAKRVDAVIMDKVPVNIANSNSGGNGDSGNEGGDGNNEENSSTMIMDLIIENIKFKEGYELKNYELIPETSEISIIPTIPGAPPCPLTITQKTSNDGEYYEFTMTQNSNNYTQYAVNILLPSNTTFEDKYELSEAENKYLPIGLDQTIQYPTIKINGETIDDIEGTGDDASKIQNLENFINQQYILKIDGVYSGEPIQSEANPDGISLSEVQLSSENFQEYSSIPNSNVSDIINIEYGIKTTQENIDGTTTTYETTINIEYPNNMTLLNDMNGAFTNYICYRNFDITKNIYKTFIIEDNILEKNDERKKYAFSTDNWLHSVKKLMYTNSKTSPYVDVHDLKLKMLTNSTRQADYAQYMKPVLIKYFIQWINNYDMHLIVNQNNYGFSDVSAFINDNEYKLQVITDNLFGLDYSEIVDNTLEIYSSGSRFKMIIQLL